MTTSKTMRLKQHSSRKAAIRDTPSANVYAQHASAILLTLILTHTGANADANISDDWDRSGHLTLQSGASRLVFGKDATGISMHAKSDVKREKGVLIVPFQSVDVKTGSLTGCEAGRSVDAQLEVRVTFSNGRETIEATILTNDAGDVQIRPGRNCNGISVHAPIDFVVQPGRILDDVLFDPAAYPDATRLQLPSENMLMGLLEAQDRVLICAWPPGEQRVTLYAGDAEFRGKSFRAVELELDGKPLHLGMLAAPEIWHREPLQSSWLEKDVEIPWQRPFAAKWKTHLFEGGEMETAYAVREEKGEFWRAGLAVSPYPIWFDGDRAFVHLSKKFPAKQPIFIYPFEDHESTPIEFAARSIGNVSSLRGKERIKFPDSVTGMYSCDGHDYITRMFRMGLHTKEKKFLHEGLADLMRRTRTMGNRLQDYEDFIDAMSRKLRFWQQRSNTQARSFLDEMAGDLQELKLVHEQQMGELTAAEFLRYQIQTMEKVQTLLDEAGTEVYPEAAFLIEENHQAAALTEHVGLRVGGRARQWALEAARRCADNPDAVSFAEEIRRDIRDLLGEGTWHEGVW